jgi:hypothetical protein
MQQIQVVKEKEKSKQQSRYSKGVVIAVSRRILKVHGEQNAWLVESEKTDGKFYKVTFASCECPDYMFRLKGTSPCKHQIACMKMGAI